MFKNASDFRVSPNQSRPRVWALLLPNKTMDFTKTVILGSYFRPSCRRNVFRKLSRGQKKTQTETDTQNRTDTRTKTQTEEKFSKVHNPQKKNCF